MTDLWLVFVCACVVVSWLNMNVNIDYIQAEYSRRPCGTFTFFCTMCLPHATYSLCVYVCVCVCLCVLAVPYMTVNITSCFS